MMKNRALSLKMIFKTFGRKSTQPALIIFAILG